MELWTRDYFYDVPYVETNVVPLPALPRILGLLFTYYIIRHT